MLIQEALKVNGRARREEWYNKKLYVMKGFDFLVRYDGEVFLGTWTPTHLDILATDWLPYVEPKPIPTITPKAGELWKHEETGATYGICFTYEQEGRLRIKWGNGGKDYSIYNPIIHGQNGWERIYPEVKEK